MTKPIKIAFHKPTGQLKHIDIIEPGEKGLRCNCYCFKCGEKLQAVLEFQDSERIKFFRHDSNTSCEGSQVTALHELGKQIIVDNKQIAVPNYNTISYSNPRAEQRFEKIRPDVSAIYDNKPIYFEIFVSHAVDNGKEIFFKQGKHRSIEIDLSNCSTSSFEEIKKLVIDETGNKKVFYWLDEEQIAEQNPDWISQIFEYLNRNWKEIISITGVILILRNVFIGKRKR